MRRPNLNPRVGWDFDVPFRVSQHDIQFVARGWAPLLRSVWVMLLLVFSMELVHMYLTGTWAYWGWMDTLSCVAMAIVVFVLARGIALSLCSTVCVLDARDPSRGRMSVVRPWSKAHRDAGSGATSLTVAGIVVVAMGRMRTAIGLVLRCGEGRMLIACGSEARVEAYRDRLRPSVACLESNLEDVAITVRGY